MCWFIENSNSFSFFIVHLANNNVATLRHIDKVLSKEPIHNSIYNTESSSYRLLKEKIPSVNAEHRNSKSSKLVTLKTISSIQSYLNYENISFIASV